MNKLTVRARFMIIMIVGVSAILILGAVFLISQQQVRVGVTNSNSELKEFYGNMLTARGAIEKMDKVFRVVIATKGMGALSELGKLVQNQETFVNAFKFIAENPQLSEFHELTKDIQTRFDKLVGLGKATGLAYLEGNVDEATKLSAEIDIQNAELLMKIDELSASMIKSKEDSLFDVLVTIRNVVLVITAVLFMLSLFVTFTFYRVTNSNLTDVSGNIMTSSQRNQSLSTMFQKAFDSISLGARNQKSSVDESMSAILEISTLTQKNVGHVTRAVEKSAHSLSIADEGREAFKRVSDSMNEIHDNSNDLMEELRSNNAEVAEVLKIIQKVAERTSVINDIVFQTKLLSFNASVEAARAGEAGKGFSVVAEEVGNLAGLTGKTAAEITELVQSSVVQVRELIESMNTRIEKQMKTTKAKINNGMDMANLCSESFQQVVTNTEEISRAIDEIKVAFDEQVAGMSRISETAKNIQAAIIDGNHTIDNATKNVHELFEESNRLRTQVTKLEHLVRRPAA